MYECPNCGGNLKFNIARQKLYCEHCETTVDPYKFYKEKDAEERVIPVDDAGAEIPEGAEEEYEVTVFTCPQCGGEILSEDTTAATFCSFCGSATILDSRVSRERKPSYIIPFTKTKEDCEAAYAKMMRRAIFAPKELKDQKHIEKFRGIYMPYWVYSFEKNGPASFPGKTTQRRGDYVYTKHYQLACEVEEKYEGLAYDASASFSDNLSNAIAPFDLRKGKPFAPTFLSGFYADTSDVDRYVYESDAENIVIRDACNRIARQPGCRKYHVNEGPNLSPLRNAVRPTKSEAELAMLPVWFLSYRKGDRVSYAVVNGQTGEMAADLPIDWKRYLLGSALLTIPLFVLLNLFFTITPTTILWIAAALALICALISGMQLSHLFAREAGEDDKGLMAARLEQKKAGRKWSAQTQSLAAAMAEGRERQGGNRQGKEKKKSGSGRIKDMLPTLAKPLLGIVFAVMIQMLNPVADEMYYIGTFVCMGTVLWAIMDIIRHYNLLTTRKLPQFNRRGGDENA